MTSQTGTQIETRGETHVLRQLVFTAIMIAVDLDNISPKHLLSTLFKVVV